MTPDSMISLGYKDLGNEDGARQQADRAVVNGAASVSAVPASVPRASIAKLWAHTHGKAWEPNGGTNTPSARKLIAAGYVEVCDLRCGFEALRDAGLRWTEAGRIAAQAIAQPQSPSPDLSSNIDEED